MKRNLILLCTLLCMSMATHAVQVWDGTSAPWTKGSGTETDPYLIETPANFAYLAEQANAKNWYVGIYFLQTDDFDSNGHSMNVGTFSGHYDGGNHQILNVRSFLFYTIQSATIQNLTIAGDTKYPLVYQVNGNATLTNCHNKSTAEITEGGAGLISQAQSGRVTLTRCSNAATIKSNFKDTNVPGYTPYYYSGGLVCCADTVIMHNCNNSGTVSHGDIGSSSSSYSRIVYVGGLLGWATYIDISHCFNTGDIYYTPDNGGTTLNSVSINSRTAGIAMAKSGSIKQSYSHSGSNYRGNKNIKYGISNLTCSGCYATNANPGGDKYAILFNYATTVYYVSSSAIYYEGKTPIQINNTSGTKIDVSGSKSATELKSPSFLSLLNADGDYFYPDYTNINNGYPILRWQLGDTPFYTIRGICKSEQGTVSGTGEYPQGAQVKLTATPKDNYTFIGWSDGNTNNPRTISVDKAATYVAQFDRLSYTVYVNQDCSITVE